MRIGPDCRELVRHRGKRYMYPAVAAVSPTNFRDATYAHLPHLTCSPLFGTRLAMDLTASHYFKPYVYRL